MVGAGGADGVPRLDELDLERVSALLDLCRKKGVVRISTTEIVLGPPPMLAGAAGKNGASQSERARRDHYEILLGRPVSKEDLENMP